MDSTTRQLTQLERLKKELVDIRQASLSASRNGDYMRVARLTALAAGINRDIQNLESIISDPK